MNKVYDVRTVAGAVPAARYGQKHGGVSRWRLSYEGVTPMCAAVDAVVIVLSALIGGGAYQHAAGYGSNPGDISGDFSTFLGLGLMSSIIYALAAWHFRLYTVAGIQQFTRDYLRIITGWLFVILVITLLLFLLKIGANVSRGSVVSFFALSIVSLLVCRLAAKKFLRRALMNGLIQGRRGILLGTRDELAAVSNDHLLMTYGIDEIDRVAIPTRKADSIGGSKLEDAAVTSALAKARTSGAEEIILAFSWANSTQLDLVRERLRISPLPVQILPDRFIRGIFEASAGSLQPIHIQRSPLTRAEQAAKRAFDIVVAGGIMFMLLPLMLLTMLAIKLDSPGPVIFRQRRNGFNGQEFLIYKFRTMIVMEDGPKVEQARENDVRVTRIGRLLRRYSIDELPQFVNVLLGQMSLVGPRPHALAHDDEYGALIVNYAFRHHVKPGITGWAQVNGYRGATPQIEQMKGRIDLDLWYINNWNIMLDLQIVTKTVLELARGRNAY